MPVDRILALGAETYEGGDPGVFNMAVMGLRLGQRANGVSLAARPGQPRDVRRAVAGLRRRRRPDHVDHQRRPRPDLGGARGARPRGSATVGPELVEEAHGWEAIADIPDDRDLGDQARPARAARADGPAPAARRRGWQRGASDAELGWVDDVLDPDVLTIGFARRVPSYKRLTLMLRDPERLRALLLDPERPVQLVIAGKSHPADDGGKRLIQELVRFSDDPTVRHRIVFLPDYDIGDGRAVLYPGCDVWLNNPLRPLEACGTSGMKAALNGCLNLSILDGWWDEWYDGENGWAIPTADGVDDPDRRDDLEAAALYDLIEKSVAPRFYDAMRRRPAAPLDRHGAAHAADARPQGAGQPDGARLRLPAVRCRRPGRAVACAADGHATGPATSRRGRTACARPGRGCGSTTSRPTGRRRRARCSGTPGRRRGPSSTLGELTPGRRGGRSSSTAGSTPTTASCTPAHDAAAPRGAAADGRRGATRSRCRWTGPGPFGYTVRVLPRHPVLATPAELGLQTLPAATVGHGRRLTCADGPPGSASGSGRTTWSTITLRGAARPDRRAPGRRVTRDRLVVGGVQHRR